jgi:hypothetical protein
MFQNVFNQNFVYDESGGKIWFKSDDLDITFEDSKSFSSIATKNEQLLEPKSIGVVAATPTLVSLLPSVIDMGFRLTNSILENNVKEYTAEYTKQKSNLNAGFNSAKKMKNEKSRVMRDDIVWLVRSPLEGS